ncbi:MAG: LacI family DNA-binding transcriptional regulator [Blastochloris sp.]|nr:LacI family DNA-binding transcriptional regulator [Blastochloris sp.]
MEWIKISDVARRAGVNPSTVSRALRDDPRISLARRKMIQTLATQMGYRPNALVSALMASRGGKRKLRVTSTIAFLKLIPEERWRELPMMAHYQEGARKRAEERGYDFETFSPFELRMSLPRLQQVLIARGIQGLCLGPMLRHYSHLKLDWDRFAVAAIGRTLVRPEVHRAVADHYQGMQLALRELRRRGWTRIGFCINETINKRVLDLWLASFMAFGHRHPRMKLLLHEKKGQMEDLPRWLSKSKPEVIVTDSYWVRVRLRKLGIKFPQDVGYCVLGWLPEAESACGVDQGDEGIAAAAIDLIIGQLQRNERGVPMQARTVLLNSRWVEGGSLGEGKE